MLYGEKISDQEITRIHRKLSRQMENIILIGMPGCGKTTIGSLLAKKLGRELVDLDSQIVQSAGKTIPEIFSQEGEAGFRDWESRILAQYGKQSGLILSTGGGCVTQPRNYPLLHQNGTIFWLQRELSLLPTDGRPLSQQNRLEDLYKARKDLYESFADYVVDNNTPPEKTAAEIIGLWEAEK